MDFNGRDKLTFNCLIALPKWILMTYTGAYVSDETELPPKQSVRFICTCGKKCETLSLQPLCRLSYCADPCNTKPAQ